MTLTEFLLARITEDGAAARQSGLYPVGQPNDPDCPCEDDGSWFHFRNARILAECEAKRRIVELHPIVKGERVLAVDSSGTDFGCGTCHCIDPIHADGIVEALGWCETLLALAIPYADHPDYQQEWKP